MSLIEVTFSVGMLLAEAEVLAADESTLPLISTFLSTCFSRSSLPALRFKPLA